MASPRKIGKRKLNSSTRFASTYRKQILKELESVRKSFLRRVRKRMSSYEKRQLFQRILRERNLGAFIRQNSIENQIRGMDLQGKRFLREMDRRKRGLKPTPKTTLLISGANKNTLSSFNYTQSVRAFERNLIGQSNEIRQSVRSAATLEDSYTRMFEKYIDEMDLIEKNWKKELNKISRRIKKRHLYYAKMSAKNSANAGYQRGEVEAARLSGQRILKKWITMFDSKVREAHAGFMPKTIELKQRFRLPSKAGFDYVLAPKVMPMSPENYYNCRCVINYQVVKIR